MSIFKAFIKKYAILLSVMTVMTILLITLYRQESKVTDNSIEEFKLSDLKGQLDEIHTNQKKLDSSMVVIDLKIDSVKVETSKSKSNITNIYKTEINEKTKLNKATDSANRVFFDDYINNWIRSNEKVSSLND